VFFLTRQPLPETDEISRRDERLRYHIRASHRRRTMAIQVRPGGEVRVMTPAAVSLSALRRFVMEHFTWIRRKQLELIRPSVANILQDGGVVPYLDKTLSLRLSLGAGSRSRVVRDSDGLHVHASDGTQVRDLLEGWYRRQARVHFTQRADHFVPIVGSHPASISIRGQRTRWGSCSAHGAVSLNWRLLQAPARLLDYVVVHELCHLRHLNHSVRFWGEVERVLPDYRALRRELRDLRKILVL
jgi:hypothetical protein